MKPKGSKIASIIDNQYRREKLWKEKIEKEKKRKENDIDGKSKNWICWY